MAEQRSALIIAVSQYQDAALSQLVAPAQDAENLARVLGDPAIGGFTVKTLLNQLAHQVSLEIEAFFANRRSEELLLLYFSGHGIKDEAGRLYVAMTDTNRKFLRTTAVAATLINEMMHHSRSRRQVLILDCCYSGAFARGMTMKADATVDTGEYFRGGRGQVVLTASDAMQYAFEGDEIKGQGVCSVFTDTLVRGLETGEADLDGDGNISCDELYDYLHERVTNQMPHQNPRKWSFAVEGDIIIAHNPHPVVKLSALPLELQQSIEDLRPWVREGAARHLEDILQQDNHRLAVAAHAALQRLAKDDSQKVQAVVAEILKAHAGVKPLAEEPEKFTTVPPEKVEAQPTPSTLQSIHGWPASKVQDLQRQTASALGQAVEFRDILKDGSPGPLLVVIPGGRFLMGSPMDEMDRNSNERQHEVEVAPFAIGKYTTIFEEYDRFAEATQRDKPSDQGWGRGRWPVIHVMWFDAVSYADWLSQQTGHAYRLPTEAEWEYACRAGTKTAYHFGASIKPDLGNYRDSGFFKTLVAVFGENRTVEIGRYPANAWGLHDMHGNVWEWTCSVYDKDYSGGEQRCAAPGTPGPCVLRGGSWDDGPRGLRGAARFLRYPDWESRNAGFRLARTLPARI